MCRLRDARTCEHSHVITETEAKRDIRRLKINWLFVIAAYMLSTINYTCVAPTNHQFIINPTAEALNITSENIEPGLGQSEMFYSFTYVTLFLGYTISAVAVGLIFNFIPTWYLFLASTLFHTLGYLLYALAVTGWMMLLARILAGFALGSVVSTIFAYYNVSFAKYTEDLKMLDEFNEKKAAKMKGYLFSSYNVGFVLGSGFGAGFPAILAQFPDTPQFRPAGWFCVATGVVLLLLQFALFHGECMWHNNLANCKCSKRLPSLKRKKDAKGVKVFCEVFIPLYIVFFGGVKGMRYVFSEILLNPIVSDSFGFSDEETTYIFLVLIAVPPLDVVLIYTLQYFKFRGFGLTVLGMTSTIIALLFMTDWQAIGTDPCVDYSLFHHPQLGDQYKLQLARTNVSDSGLVSVQSLQVVEDDVYQMAVNRCESAGDHCHWIPNSQVTHKHCSDCQPICRDTRHTLNFVQFMTGLVLYFLTLSLAHSGMFLLLSDIVGQSFKGISIGSMVALNGVARSTFPILVDGVYEGEGKRTYLSMLIQVAIYTPLLVGLILLYPWLAPIVSQTQQNNDTEDGHNKDHTSHCGNKRENICR